MKLLIPKKTFLLFLSWAIVVMGIFVMTIEVTPKEYNSIIGLSWATAVLLGLSIARFNDIVWEAKKKMEEK